MEELSSNVHNLTTNPHPGPISTEAFTILENAATSPSLGSVFTSPVNSDKPLELHDESDSSGISESHD